MLANERDLKPGQKIGHYEILSTLGRGGMGEVYLARDTRLGRKVALKFLPWHFTNDAERLRRFEQEARTASALNHPNILTIHEIGEVEGRRFIATEFVDGQTLRQRLATGPLEIHEALKISEQIASALAAAQPEGIIHRDIKPENIMIRRDGIVKVLDFGLAKLIAARPTAVDTEAATKTLFRTNPGLVLGTASYMSPEQARGVEVDAGTDIFSLGVVVYEMVAGCLPFAGATTSEVLAAILGEKQPPPLARFARDVPRELEHIVSKALRKDREERYQTAKDMLIDLKDLRRDLEVEAQLERTVPPTEKFGVPPSSGPLNDAKSSPPEGSTPNTETLPVQAAKTGPTAQAETVPRATSSAAVLLRRHKGIAALILATLFIVVAAFIWAAFKLTGQHQLQPAARFEAMKFQRLTSTGKTRLAAISPDGKYVVYALGEPGQQSLWVRHVATSSNVRIVPSAEVDYRGITFSLDGNYIYYVVREKNNLVQVLYQMPVLGGAAKKIIVDIDSLVTFSPDGKRLAFCRFVPAQAESTLMVANVEGTSERTLAVRSGNLGFAQDAEGAGPAWSPDGKTIVGAAIVDTGSRYMSLIEVGAEDGAQRPITPQKWANIGRVSWLRDGRGFIMNATDKPASSSQIWQLSYPGGQARRITNDLSDYRDVTLTADSNVLVAVQTDRNSSLWVAPNAEATRATQLMPGKIDGAYGLSWTPDGRIVYTSNSGGNLDIWIMDPDGSNQKQLTRDAGINHVPSVSADGRYIVFSSDRSGASHIWRMGIDGGNPKELTSGSYDIHPRCSPEGQWVAYASVSSGKGTVWKVGIDGNVPVKLSDNFSSRPSISPDGKYVACFFLIEEQVYSPSKFAILSFEGGQLIKLLDVPQTSEALYRWTGDGRAVMYIDTRNGISNIWSQPIDGGSPKQLTDFKSDRIFWFEWSRDGKQLALARGTETNDVVLISNFK